MRSGHVPAGGTLEAQVTDVCDLLHRQVGFQNCISVRGGLFCCVPVHPAGNAGFLVSGPGSLPSSQARQQHKAYSVRLT